MKKYSFEEVKLIVELFKDSGKFYIPLTESHIDNLLKQNEFHKDTTARALFGEDFDKYKA